MQVSLSPQYKGNLTCNLPFLKHTQSLVIFQVRRVLSPVKFKARTGKQDLHLGPFYQAIVLKSYFLRWSRNMSHYPMKTGKER